MEHCRELHEAVTVDCKIDDARRLTADRSTPSRRFIQPVLKLVGPPDIVSDARRERISKNRDPKFPHRLVQWIVGSGDVSPLIRAPMAEPRGTPLACKVGGVAKAHIGIKYVLIVRCGTIGF